MALFAILGVIAGILGFLPLLGSLHATKRVTTTSNLSHAGALLLGVLASFLILAGTLIACVLVARDMLLPFALGEVLTLSAVAIAYGIYKLVRK
ncbi:MAG: hypothetical protein RR655_04765 [Raoultibacter sp.]